MNPSPQRRQRLRPLLTSRVVLPLAFLALATGAVKLHSMKRR